MGVAEKVLTEMGLKKHRLREAMRKLREYFYDEFRKEIEALKKENSELKEKLDNISVGGELYGDR